MIHPCLATMLAVVTTDYPLAPGEAATPSCGRRSSGRFNRISVDGDCSTNDAVVLLANGAVSLTATRRRTSNSRSALRSGLREPRAADRRRRRRRHGRPRDQRSPALPRRRKRRRSRAASRPRRSSRRRRSAATRTGAASWRPRARRRGTAGFARLDPDRLCASRSTARAVFADGAPTGRVPELGGAACRIELDLGLGDGEAAYLASDLSTDYVQLNAEYTT